MSDIAVNILQRSRRKSISFADKHIMDIRYQYRITSKEDLQPYVDTEACSPLAEKAFPFGFICAYTRISMYIPIRILLLAFTNAFE